MAGRLRVLVVDDDASIRLLCKINLELDGHEIEEAATPAEASQALARGSFDVVLVDVHLGAADGRVVVDEVHSVASGTSVVLLTGSAERGSLRDAGVDAVVGKPFTIDELRETVERVGFARR